MRPTRFALAPYGCIVTAAQRQHLFNVILLEIVTAFVLVMVAVVALYASGRFDTPRQPDGIELHVHFGQ